MLCYEAYLIIVLLWQSMQKKLVIGPSLVKKSSWNFTIVFFPTSKSSLSFAISAMNGYTHV